MNPYGAISTGQLITYQLYFNMINTSIQAIIDTPTPTLPLIPPLAPSPTRSKILNFAMIKHICPGTQRHGQLVHTRRVRGPAAERRLCKRRRACAPTLTLTLTPHPNLDVGALLSGCSLYMTSRRTSIQMAARRSTWS